MRDQDTENWEGEKRALRTCILDFGNAKRGRRMEWNPPNFTQVESNPSWNSE